MDIKHLVAGFVASTSLMGAGIIEAQSADVIGNLSGDVSVSAGMASYHLPIATPGSIHDLNPGISINYQQQSSASILGVGFALSASSSIMRCTANIQKDGFSSGIEIGANSRFCHGGKKLVAVSGENGGSNSEYRTYIDNNDKYQSIGGSNFTPDKWIQYSPDGYIYHYQRQEFVNDLFANWLLVRKENQFGSGIDYYYTNDSIPRLSKIEYPGYKIDFAYELRSHSLMQYRQGIQISMDHLLSKILVSTSEPMYEYRFNYEQVAGDHVTSDRLKSVTRCYGLDGVSGCLKPVEFSYLEQPDSRQAYDLPADKTVVIPRDYYHANGSLRDIGFTYRPSFVSGDLNLDGYADFCYYKPNTGIVCTLHQGHGYGPITTWSGNLGYAANEDDYLYFSQLSLQDLNGDGLADYCLADNKGVRCALNNGGSSFGQDSYWAPGNLITNTDPDLPVVSYTDSPRFYQVDGDNLPDLCAVLETDGIERYSCFRNTGNSSNTFYGEILNLDVDLNISEKIDVSGVVVHQELEEILDDDGFLPVSSSSPNWFDIDGDMDLDICWLSLNGDFNCSLRSTNPISQTAEYSAPVKLLELAVPQAPVAPSNNDYVDYYEALAKFTLPLRHGDLNGDGLLDICYEKAGNYQCHINTGAGFAAGSAWLSIGNALSLTQPSGLSSSEKESFKVRAKGTRASVTLNDVSFDGLADFCVIFENFQKCAYNQGGAFAELVPKQVIHPDLDLNVSKTSGYNNFVQKVFGVKTRYKFYVSGASYGKFLSVGDVNNDGYIDNCYRGIDGVLCITDDNFAPHALLTSVTDSFGQRTDIAYSNLLGSGRYLPTPATDIIPQGFHESPPNRRVVTSITSDSGADDSSASPNVTLRNTIEYYYQGNIVNLQQELGGFTSVEWRNPLRGTKTRSTYYQQEHLQGREKQIDEYLDGVLVRQKVNNQEAVEQANGTVRLFLNSTTETQNDLGGNLVNTSQITHSGMEIDPYGFAQRVVSRKTQGAETLNTDTNTTYWHDTSRWILGRPDYQTVTHSDQIGRAIIRDVDYQYEGSRLVREVLQPSSTYLALTIEYSNFDLNGLAQKVTKSGSGLTRELNKTFDTRGRIKTASSAPGQVEAFTYHARCGGVETHTDIAGRITTTKYDSLCRDYQVEAPDSNVTTREYFWANATDNDWFYQPSTGDHTNPVIYKVKESTAAGPWQTSFYDAQGRVVRTEALGYSDNTTQREAVSRSIYDRYGRKTATALPYYRDNNGFAITPSWITINYDNAGRPSSETKMGPDGITPVTTTYAYQRLTTTLSYADYQKTTITGIHGKPLHIDENGLTIDYDYDPLGNLLSTTTQGLTTVVEYDERGNKEKQIDPDMGEWNYGYNAFGELDWQRDAELQTTRFIYDALGRQKSRTDADGGITVWEYYLSGNGIGQLKSEDSPDAKKSWQYNVLGLVTSETLLIKEVQPVSFTTLFDYDIYSRLVTRTEPDGEKKQFGYDATGSLDSISINDFKDVDLTTISNEYQALLTAFVQKEKEYLDLMALVEYHHQRALEYHELELFFLAELNKVTGIQGEEAAALATIEAAAKIHEDRASRYETMATATKAFGAGLLAAHGGKQFKYKGLNQGSNEFKFEHKKCTKRRWYGKCKKYRISRVNVPAWELNQVDIVDGSAYSVKHNVNTSAISRTYYTGKDGTRKVTRTYYRPDLIYADTARKWKDLAKISRSIAAEIHGGTAEGSTTAVLTETGANLTTPVQVGTGLAWVPIAGDITIFVQATVPIIEHQTVIMTLAQAGIYYDEKYQYYKAEAEEASAAHQLLVDGNGAIIGLAELQDDLTSLSKSAGYLYNNLESMGVDLGDLGDLSSLNVNTPGRMHVWMATMRGPGGELESELFGNGLQSVRHVNRATGLVEGITTSSFSGTQTMLRDIQYQYNSRGQIYEKTDLLTAHYQTQETFNYDPQGRLGGWTYQQTKTSLDDPLAVAQTASLQRLYDYDNRGNMIFKTGAGSMHYDPTSNRLQSRLAGNGLSYAYSYDANGSMLSGDNRSYIWSSFNKVQQINAGNQTVNFRYDGSRRRVVKTSDSETVYYVSAQYEKVIYKDGLGQPLKSVHRHQLQNGFDTVATFQKTDATTVNAIEQHLAVDQIAYYHRDIIGSGEVVTGSQMNVLKRRFYTPYGELIQDLLLADGQVAEADVIDTVTATHEIDFDGTMAEYRQIVEAEISKASSFQLQLDRLIISNDFQGSLKGYTSHEEIAEVGLVNMNARLYDPVIGRFISADTIIPSLGRPSSYNRYAYVEGNPVSTRDPSGHFGWALAFFVAAHLTDNPALQLASTIYLGAQMSVGLEGAWGTTIEAHYAAAASAATISVSITVLKTGRLTSADLTNTAWTALAAGVSNYVGHGNETLEGLEWYDSAGLHGLTQGGINVLRGDKFVAGFAAGLAGSLSGEATSQFGNPGDSLIGVRTAIASGFGYLAAEAAGGDGAQGAVQAALVHLFNAEAEKAIDKLERKYTEFATGNPDAIIPISENDMNTLLKHTREAMAIKGEQKHSIFGNILDGEFLNHKYEGQFGAADTFLWRNKVLVGRRFSFQGKTDFGGDINYIAVGMLARSYGHVGLLRPMVITHNLDQFFSGKGVYNLYQIEPGSYWAFFGANRYYSK